MRRTLLVLGLCASGMPSSYAHDGRVAVPAHYVVKPHCVPDRGFVAVAQAPNFPAAYPMLNLLVFNGEVVGFLFEADEKDGWKPWYNEPQGQPASHAGGPRHYTQTIMIKKGPTAQECKAAEVPEQRQ